MVEMEENSCFQNENVISDEEFFVKNFFDFCEWIDFNPSIEFKEQFVNNSRDFFELFTTFPNVSQELIEKTRNNSQDLFNFVIGYSKIRKLIKN
jgi:hypothetical protein